MTTFLGRPGPGRRASRSATCTSPTRRTASRSPRTTSTWSRCSRSTPASRSRTRASTTQVQRLAVVEERERIGKDLHDGIIQAIYAVSLSLEMVPDLIDDAAGRPEAEARVDRAIDALNLVIADIRSYILRLRPASGPGGPGRGPRAPRRGARDARGRRPRGGPRRRRAAPPRPAARPPVGPPVHRPRGPVATSRATPRASRVVLVLDRAATTSSCAIEDNGRGIDPNGSPTARRRPAPPGPRQHARPCRRDGRPPRDRARASRRALVSSSTSPSPRAGMTEPTRPAAPPDRRRPRGRPPGPRRAARPPRGLPGRRRGRHRGRGHRAGAPVPARHRRHGRPAPGRLRHRGVPRDPRRAPAARAWSC